MKYHVRLLTNMYAWATAGIANRITKTTFPAVLGLYRKYLKSPKRSSSSAMLRRRRWWWGESVEAVETWASARVYKMVKWESMVK